MITPPPTQSQRSNTDRQTGVEVVKHNDKLVSITACLSLFDFIFLIYCILSFTLTLFQLLLLLHPHLLV